MQSRNHGANTTSYFPFPSFFTSFLSPSVSSALLEHSQYSLFP